MNLVRKLSVIKCLALATGVILSSHASAGLIYLEASLDGAQANAGLGTGSPGTGSATMTLDDTSNLFSWDISWAGLFTPVIVGHFHGPALPAQNAGVQVDLGPVSGASER